MILRSFHLTALRHKECVMATQQLILSLMLATLVFSIAGNATGRLVRTKQVFASRLEAKSAFGPFHTCASSYYFYSKLLCIQRRRNSAASMTMASAKPHNGHKPKRATHQA